MTLQDHHQEDNNCAKGEGKRKMKQIAAFSPGQLTFQRVTFFEPQFISGGRFCNGVEKAPQPRKKFHSADYFKS